MADVDRLIVFPGWRDNPFLNLLYLATAARGVRFDYVRSVSWMRDKVEESGPGTILHVHWTAPVVAGAHDEAEAWQLVEEFRTVVRLARRRGLRVVWTVHNTLPHEIEFRGPEVEVCRLMAAEADLVHTMVPQTASIVADDYVIDSAKEQLVPHPSYQGLYAVRPEDRQEARAHLGLDPQERTILFFGQIRPYKGVGTLLDALAALERDGRSLPTVLMAGHTPEGVEEEITERLPGAVRAVRHHGFVEDADVATWFAAADLAVYPYEKILNSGSVHLAATLGVPSVLPGQTHLRELFATEPWIRFYDPADPVESLADLLADPASYERDVEALRDFSERLAPWNISQDMWRALNDLV